MQSGLAEITQRSYLGGQTDVDLNLYEIPERWDLLTCVNSMLISSNAHLAFMIGLSEDHESKC